MKALALTFALTAIACLPFSNNAQAGAQVAIDPSYSASWFNHEESGHGVMIHLVDEQTAWLCWFAFDLAGNPAWICAIGAIAGDTIEFPDAFTIEGGAFPPNFEPDLIVEIPWGSITIVFSGCDSGTMTWTTDAAGYQSGSMPLVRLTTLWGNDCIPGPDQTEITIPRSSNIPTIDGIASAGEWSDAVTVDIVINGQWTVPVSLKNDGQNLYALFSNVGGPNDENRVPAANATTTFPELFVDVTPDDNENIDNSIYWFHASFQDCYANGRIAVANNCAVVQGLWDASNWPLGDTRDHSEIRISYGRMGLAPNQSHQVGLFGTMTSSLLGNNVYYNWPGGSLPNEPSTWGLAELE